MSEYRNNKREQEEFEATAEQEAYAQQHAGMPWPLLSVKRRLIVFLLAMDYYGQAAAGAAAAQQTNLAAQYGDLANNPELAHLLQVRCNRGIR